MNIIIQYIGHKFLLIKKANLFAFYFYYLFYLKKMVKLIHKNSEGVLWIEKRKIY
jgi:hypothetical protein